MLGAAIGAPRVVGADVWLVVTPVDMEELPTATELASLPGVLTARADNVTTAAPPITAPTNLTRFRRLLCCNSVIDIREGSQKGAEETLRLRYVWKRRSYEWKVRPRPLAVKLCGYVSYSAAVDLSSAPHRWCCSRRRYGSALLFGGLTRRLINGRFGS
jgi:hypothetical protein